MYNPYQAPPYGRPPGYGGFPGAQPGGAPGMGAPPGMGPPPGMPSAPGIGAPPGIPQQQAQQPGRHGGLPPNFQPPPNMPNINFAAPVIRLGTTGPAKPAMPAAGGRREDPMSAGPGRPGLGANQGGMEQHRQQMRESMMALVPPTREEIARTIFVGKIRDDLIGDDGMESILRAAGNLRRWHRATDADGKKCSFGFAEYEDAISLGTAVEILKDVQVPRKKQETNGADSEDVNGDAEDRKLLVVVDENSLEYLEQYHPSRGNEDPAVGQARLDTARQALSSVLSELENPSAPTPQPNVPSSTDQDGDMAMQDGPKTEGAAEVITIPLTVDDELSDIPIEMRETVAQEIAAFRDRSNRRDMERLKREEELEALEKSRNFGQQRPNRLASPPPQAPSGPAGGANGIPLGPRDRGVQGAPSGPKGYMGHQLPRDYQKGVTFVNGTGVNGISKEDEDTDASDEELERRRRAKREAELGKLYLDQERRWLNRERSRTAAVEREKTRDKEEEVRREREKEIVAKRLREWNDDLEVSRKVEEYYVDRSMWIRNRASFRQREMQLDEQDRAAEEREKMREMEKKEQAKDQHPGRQPTEEQRQAQQGREPQRFKLSLGAAAQKAQAAANSRRTVAEVEGLLEDEEETSGTAKRTLIPIKFDSAAEAQSLTQEERDEAVRQLAQEIPSDKEGLWKWDVKWDLVDEAVIGEKLKPFVEKKIVEYLGVQEQMLVEVVEEHIRKRGGPQELVEQLEGALDEEAEPLVKKLWRMMIFFSESEKRGLSA